MVASQMLRYADEDTDSLHASENDVVAQGDDMARLQDGRLRCFIARL